MRHLELPKPTVGSSENTNIWLLPPIARDCIDPQMRLTQYHAKYFAHELTKQPYQVRQGGKSHWLDKYFNTAAFKPNATGTFGDSGRNLFQGPPLNTADVGNLQELLDSRALRNSIPVGDVQCFEFWAVLDNYLR